jgi:hypothetical protein
MGWNFQLLTISNCGMYGIRRRSSVECQRWMASNASAFRALLEQAFSDSSIHVAKAACRLLTQVCIGEHAPCV